MTSRFVGPHRCPLLFPFAWPGFCSRVLSLRPGQWETDLDRGTDHLREEFHGPKQPVPIPLLPFDLVKFSCETVRSRGQGIERSTFFLVVARPLPSLLPVQLTILPTWLVFLLPGQQRRSLTKELDRRPVFIVRFPPQPIPFRLSYARQLFSVDPPNSSPLRPIGSQYPLPITVYPVLRSVNKSVNSVKPRKGSSP